MASPTPISAILHSATLVCTGVYLIKKYRIENNIIIYISIIFTILLSLNIYDIKRYLAISTSNNMSLILLNNHHSSIFHFINHGFYKSILFLLSGCIIHLFFNQDLRKLNGMIFISPLLLKLYLFFLLPIPYLIIESTKDLLLASIPNVYNLIIFILNSLIYYIGSNYIYYNIVNCPNYNYYIDTDKSVYEIYKYIIIIIIITILYGYSISILNISYIDLIPIIIFISNLKFNNSINLLFHLENLFNKSFKFLLLGLEPRILYS